MGPKALLPTLGPSILNSCFGHSLALTRSSFDCPVTQFMFSICPKGHHEKPFSDVLPNSRYIASAVFPQGKD